MEIEANRRSLRSQEAVEKVFILFINSTGRSVDVIWIDYEGNPVPYMTLDPGSHSMLFTFKTHPWIFRDYYTGEPMHVSNDEIYLPVPFVHKHTSFHNAILQKQIIIHFPLRTLKESSMWQIVKSTKNITDIDTFEIPLQLKCELKNLFHTYYVHVEKLSSNSQKSK